MTIKKSFFERLSGNSSVDDAFDSFDDELPVARTSQGDTHNPRTSLLDDDSSKSDGQLPVDVHQTASDIIIRTFVAGVRPDELSISISRDMVEISGTRSEREQVSRPDYFSQELFWGSFSRTIMLPQEIDVDAASANAKDGLLTIILPKLDKAKQTKLKVKAS
ncbi:MAG: Hsp20/alpha crystallin family protein [Candidatus Paceibacterota bacterium]|jgi:HSP20 family protein